MGILENPGTLETVNGQEIDWAAGLKDFGGCLQLPKQRPNGSVSSNLLVIFLRMMGTLVYSEMFS